MGVTTHNPDIMRFPSTMTNMDSGTIMMSGCKILVNGYGNCTDYGHINLDELRVSDSFISYRCWKAVLSSRKNELCTKLSL